MLPAIPSTSHDHLAAQRLLCKFILNSPDADSAWAAWSGSAELDDLGPFSEQRLLGHLYQRLTAVGSTYSELERLKGAYRKYLYENQLLFNEVLPVFAYLKEQAIPMALMKGAALILGGYCDSGSRALLDVDLLVPADKIEQIRDHLAAEGWRADLTNWERQRKYRHAVELRKSPKCAIDLHWRALIEWNFTTVDEEFLARAEPFSFRGASGAVLAPTDLLFHTCVHAMRIHREQTYWVLDVAAILRQRGDAIDWKLFVELAERLRVTARLDECLRYLSVEFALKFPATVQQQLAVKPRFFVEQVEAFQHRLGKNTPLGESAYNLSEFLRAVGGNRARGWMTKSLDFFCFTKGLRRKRELPLFMLRRVLDIQARFLAALWRSLRASMQSGSS